MPAPPARDCFNDGAHHGSAVRDDDVVVDGEVVDDFEPDHVPRFRGFGGDHLREPHADPRAVDQPHAAGALRARRGRHYERCRGGEGEPRDHGAPPRHDQKRQHTPGLKRKNTRHGRAAGHHGPDPQSLPRRSIARHAAAQEDPGQRHHLGAAHRIRRRSALHSDS